ncbi:hypothetical protein ACLQ9F_10750 [Bordetella avium]|uniref:hypothetical protein n=1 Tax=Bordetella avium TaxID=521 RepID=UPI0039FD27F9
MAQTPSQWLGSQGLRSHQTIHSGGQLLEMLWREKHPFMPRDPVYDLRIFPHS